MIGKKTRIRSLTELVLASNKKELVITETWRGAIPAGLVLSYPGTSLVKLFAVGLYVHEIEQSL